MNVSIFGTFGWKAPLHRPKLFFFGLFVTLLRLCGLRDSSAILVTLKILIDINIYYLTP